MLFHSNAGYHTPHTGHYEPEAFHVYNQRQYALPFESRTHAPVDSGKM